MRSSTILDQLVHCKRTVLIKREVITKKGIAIGLIGKGTETKQELGVQRETVATVDPAVSLAFVVIVRSVGSPPGSVVGTGANDTLKISHKI